MLEDVITHRKSTMRLFSWWRRARMEAGQPASFAAEPFNEDCIAAIPASAGIYRLYRDGEVIYAGMASASLRRELESHRRGERGECTRAASGFLHELAADPERALRDYLVMYMARHVGRLPRCNELRHRQQKPEGRPNPEQRSGPLAR
jgi:hypothetical protein